MLRAETITKSFARKHGPVTALDQVSITIEEGEFVSITGPSGSGKSTLLLALGGMSAPSEGTVFYNNDSIYTWGVAERAKWRAKEVGFVFQAFNLIPYLTVYENVSAGLSLSGEKSVIAAKIIPLLERIKIADRRDHLPCELSVGQQQRVALARAIVKRPRLLLADEPTGNLDPDTGKEVIEIIKQQHAAGSTVVIITHDPTIARMANRTVYIAEGKIEGNL